MLKLPPPFLLSSVVAAELEPVVCVRKRTRRPVMLSSLVRRRGVAWLLVLGLTKRRRRRRRDSLRLLVLFCCASPWRGVWREVERWNLVTDYNQKGQAHERRQELAHSLPTIDGCGVCEGASTRLCPHRANLSSCTKVLDTHALPTMFAFN